MDDLAKAQEEIGQEIQNIVRNYKKDPVQRKSNKEYFIERLRRLETCWERFEATDLQIRCLPRPPLDHSYFTTDYYKATQAIYQQYKGHFNEMMNSLNQKVSTDTSTGAWPKQISTDTTHSDDVSAGKFPSSEKTNQSIDQDLPRQPLTHSSEIVRLIRRQDGVISSLSRFLSTIETSSQQPRNYHELKINTINRYWTQIENLHYNIWETEEDPTAVGYELDKYIQLETEVQEHLANLTRRLNIQGEPASHTSTSANSVLKLPKITLLKFDGDYLRWKQFHDLFSEMVHKQSMADCQKMWYLKTNLVGEAERLIRHLTLSDENYTAAWKILQDRYNNPRLLVAALVNRIMAQPSHAGETSSSNAIKSLHDTTQECLRGLENLGVPVDNWDPLLLHILMKKLDKTTHTLYEQSLSNPKGLQTIKDFLSFLENRFQSLEALGSKSKNPDDLQKRASMVKSLTSVASSIMKCVICKNNHQLFACKEFLQLSPFARLNALKRHKLCVNCMRSGHDSKNCTSRGCTKCNKRHNTLVHNNPSLKREGPDSSVSTNIQLFSRSMHQNPADGKANDNSVTLAASGDRCQEGYVFLSTAIVQLSNNDGDIIEARALLDSGSQVNLITEKVLKKLSLSSIHKPMIVQGIGRVQEQAQRRVNFHLQSKANGFTTRVEALVLPHIVPPQPARKIDTSDWPILKNLRLADPNFNRPGRVDLLLGAEFYHQLLSVGQIKLSDKLPILQNTVFGWIVAGKLSGNSPITASCNIFTTDEPLEKSIEKFWKLEERVDAEPKFTSAEKRCEAYFNQTVKRDTTGRFIVSLPFSDDPMKLGESKNTALRRFYALERKLAKDVDLRRHYVEFMEEYINLGHMEEIDPETIMSPHYFIPHHCVLKPDSTSTKLRVVFDASAKTSTNISLNDILQAGPVIQDELFSILLRFRTPRFILTADIQKMYRQIILQADDKKYHLIWWRSSPSLPLKCYQLCTVTYGTTSAPYLATKCLQKLALEYAAKYPLGSQALLRDFYVDDVMTGSNSLTTARDVQTQLTALLLEGGFKLRKWCANSQQLIQHIPPEDLEISLDHSNKEGSIKTLGLMWLPRSDQLCIRTNWVSEERITKRTVASGIARIFDPLGIVSPVVIVAKIFLQQLWQLKLDWDAALPIEMQTRWITYRDGLSTLNNIKFPRHVFAQEIPHSGSVQLHTFADASERAYGAAVYLRSATKEGRILVRLLCAKSRVAPLKQLTLPRLELCAAKLAADLADRVISDLRIEGIHSHFWTDSEIVLSWINSTSSSYHTFVANRIAGIQELTNSNQWRHVSSKDNPADVLSRGIAPEKLNGHNLWFYGPIFLHGSEAQWPAPYNATNSISCDTERKKKVLTITTEQNNNKNPEHFILTVNHGNSFRKLQRITGYVLRFVKLIKERQFPHKSRGMRFNAARYKTPSNNWPLTTQELDHALHTIVKVIQEGEFKADIIQLKKHKEVNKDSSLSSLALFLDDQGILRVGGRLQASSLTYDAKHPMLLPYAHQFVKLLMTDIHKRNLHVGPQGLLAITRQKFWPIKGKTIARSVVQHCVRCAKCKPKMFSQIMGNLPPHRVQPARPFINSGVDFCGPIWVHYRSRGSRPQKGYVAVFCCFATKAVHLEVVSDLSTNAFIGALKRFIGRRGHCNNLYCDNATNFVGAKNQLKELTECIHSRSAQEKITSTCTNRGISFHFIPPRAPHFGGLWEAAVKSAKYLLQRSVASASLSYEELCTLMTEIEAVLNSRPLTAMSSDPNDLTALTPGHFLIGEPLTATVDPHATPMKASLLTRWKLVSHIKHEFWKRWSREYLSYLQHRLKWKTGCQNAQPGTIVIVQEENTPTMKWPLGRILQTYKGKDGHVRVADVRTQSGILRRPICKLSPLPCEEMPQSNSATTLDGENEEIITPIVKRQNEDKLGDYDSGPITSHEGKNNSTIVKPRKRRRALSYGSAAVTLLLTCILLPIIRADNIEITQFALQPGIHFDNVGTINSISTEWNLVVYYDLRPYWMEFEALRNSSMALQHLCGLISQKTSCVQVINQLQHLEQELEQDNQLLTSKPFPTRVRRGAIDIVGNLANSLFGVLDSKYAEQMSVTIEEVKANEDHLLKLLKNQTSLIESTVNIIKRNQAATEQKYQNLDNQLTQIVNRINNNTEESYKLKIQQLLTSWSIHTILLVNNLQRVQSSLIDVIADAHQGRISHLLVTPYQLKQEITNIKNHLPTTIRLPTTPDNLLQFYKLMTTEGRIVNNHVIFRIKLPLLGLEEFNLFKMFPIPAAINKTLYAIVPSSTFLATSPHQDQYYPLSEQEVSKCFLLEATFLCKQVHPIYNRGANVSKCEVNLLNNLPISSECKLRRVENSPIWMQLHDANQWIYATKNKTLINAVCNKTTFRISIEGSGIITLQPTCTIKHDLMTLQGHHVYPSAARASYTRLSEFTDIPTLEHPPPIYLEATKHQAQIRELETLLKDLSIQNLNLPKQIHHHNIQHTTVSISALILTLAVIVLLIWKFRTSICIRKPPKPTPRPRTSQNLDFSVNI